MSTLKERKIDDIDVGESYTPTIKINMSDGVKT